jgi:signal transduction histidine kinase
MTVALRRRIALGTTVTTAIVVLLASVVVWLVVQTVMGRAIDAVITERMHGFLAHAMGGPPVLRPPPGSGPGPNLGSGFGPDPGREPPPDQRPARLDRPDGPDGPDGPEGPHRPEGPDRPGPPEFSAAAGTHVVQFIDVASGNEIGRSASLTSGMTLVMRQPGPPAKGVVVDMPFGDGRWLRVMRAEADMVLPHALPPWIERSAWLTAQRPTGTRRVAIYLAADSTSIHRDLRLLAGVLAALWLFATVLSALASMWLRRALLRPIDRLSVLIAAIDPDNLKTTIPATEVPVEMLTVIERLNTLIGRLDAAFNRERSTIANIAHELRTPVAGIRATLEFALARGPHASREEDLRDCLKMTESMQAMIVNLLTLARLESGQARLSPQPVLVQEVVTACLAGLAQRIRERELAFTVRIEERLAVPGGDEHLRMILGNIIDNAVSYAVAGQPVEISAAMHDGWAVIEVVNATDGRLHDVSEIFQAFWRGEAARSSGHHCGLGLTLVQRLVHLAGGTVTARLDGLNLFRLSVRLPLSAPGA